MMTIGRTYLPTELWVVKPSWGSLSFYDNDEIFLSQSDAEKEAETLSTQHTYRAVTLAEAVQSQIDETVYNAMVED